MSCGGDTPRRVGVFGTGLAGHALALTLILSAAKAGTLHAPPDRGADDVAFAVT